MRTYRNAVYITTPITIISFLGALILNFSTCVDPFWCNSLLGVFGSSILTLITSVIGYQVERRRTFEGFLYCTREMLRILNRYQSSWALDEKVNFFITYHDISFSEWDKYYGEFCFLFDFKKATKTYIYEKIYSPLLNVNQCVRHHIWHFRWYKDGTGKNEKAMQNILQEIEDLILETTKEKYPNPEDFPEDMRDSIGYEIVSIIRNKIVEDTQNELIGKYYQLMYGNKTYDKSANARDGEK